MEYRSRLGSNVRNAFHDMDSVHAYLEASDRLNESMDNLEFNIRTDDPDSSKISSLINDVRAHLGLLDEAVQGSSEFAPF